MKLSFQKIMVDTIFQLLSWNSCVSSCCFQTINRIKCILKRTMHSITGAFWKCFTSALKVFAISFPFTITGSSTVTWGCLRQDDKAINCISKLFFKHFELLKIALRPIELISYSHTLLRCCRFNRALEGSTLSTWAFDQ